MKKTISSSLALSALTLVLAGCSSGPSTPPVVGTWTGYYNGSTTAEPTASDNAYSAQIMADGTLTVYDGPINATSSKATGTWTYENNTFKATYTYTGGNQFSVEAILAGTNRLNGTWGSGTNTSGSGKFYWIKQ